MFSSEDTVLSDTKRIIKKKGDYYDLLIELLPSRQTRQNLNICLTDTKIYAVSTTSSDLDNHRSKRHFYFVNIEEIVPLNSRKIAY